MSRNEQELMMKLHAATARERFFGSELDRVEADREALSQRIKALEGALRLYHQDRECQRLRGSVTRQNGRFIGP